MAFDGCYSAVMGGHDVIALLKGFEFILICHPVGEIIYPDQLQIYTFVGFGILDASNCPVVIG